ncbi:MAG TPA: hypothetical protein VFG20_02390 [Planctomycetaceae bacterium]|nr:hypothetical protein [Planctomycetaceae bacterium]
MAGELVTVALSLALQVGQPSPSETPNAAPLQNAYNQYGFEGQFEQRYPFDSQQNWVHGYFQEIPAYGGHVFFRPYNYKDVMSQSQTSAGWGMSPTMPYSQQFWHRYHDQATMLKLSRSNGGQVPVPTPTQPAFPQPQLQPSVLPAGYANPSPAMMAPPIYYAPTNQLNFTPAPQYATPPVVTAPQFAPATPVGPVGPFLAPQ